MHRIILITCGLLAFSLVGCAARLVTKVAVQSMEIVKSEDQLQKEDAVNTVTSIFVNQGFDIKVTNKEAGLVTTEYKKFASEGDNPPFDYYLQIRASISVKQGKAHLALAPMVKEQNRMNAAAFTEHELTYYEGDPNNMKLIKSMKPEKGWRKLAQVTFMNVVSAASDAFNVPVEDMVQNVTRTEEDAMKVR